MKKLLILTLAVVMTLVTVIPASAAWGGGGSKAVSVAFLDKNGEVVTIETIYSVDIAFADELSQPLTWKSTLKADAIVWDPDRHAYINKSEDTPDWEIPSTIENAITIANHSNASVYAKVLFDGDEDPTVPGDNEATQDAQSLGNKILVQPVQPGIGDGEYIEARERVDALTGVGVRLTGTGEDGRIKILLESAADVAFNDYTAADKETIDLVPINTPINLAPSSEFLIGTIIIEIKATMSILG